MAQAVGYAILPVSASLSGITEELRSQLVGPTEKAAKQAGDAIKRSLSDGVDKATRDTEKAQWRVKKSTEELTTAESKLAEQKLKSEAANLAVEAAAKKREQAESKGVDAVAKAEQELLKKRAAAERESRNLAAAEQGVEKALTESARAAENLEEKQKSLADATEGAGQATQGLSEDLKHASADMDDVAEKSSTLGDKITSGLGTIGKGALLGVGAKIGTTIVGGVGTAFSKGFGRLQSLENAEASLKGLGRSAEDIELIMGSVSQAVKGTAFGLDEAAQSAATFSTLGVKSGEDMDRVMTLLADTTAQAGTDLSEISPIMQKVVAAGGLSMDTFDQLNERATGVGEALSKELGVPIEEVRDLASTVDFDTFARAMENNIGGAAKKSGETFGNAFGNMQAALGRLGEKFLAPAFALGPEIFGAIGGAFDKLGETIEPVLADLTEKLQPHMEEFAAKLGPWLVETIEQVANAIKNTVGWIRENAELLKTLAVGIGTAVGAWKLFTAGMKIHAAAVVIADKGWKGYIASTKIATAVTKLFNKATKANIIGLIATALIAVGGALVYFFTKTETGREMWEKFTTALADGWEWVTDKLGGGIDWIKDKFEAFTGWISDAWNGITSLFKGDFTSSMRDAFGVEEDNPLISGFLKVHEILTGIPDLVKGIGDILFKGDFTGLPFGLEEDSGIVGFLFTVRDTVIAVGDAISTAFDWILHAAKVTIGVIGTIVLTPLILAWNGLSLTIQGMWDGVIKPVWDAMSRAALAMWETYIKPAVDFIVNAWSYMSGRLVETWNIIKTAVFDAWNWYVGKVQENWAIVTGALNTAWTLVKDTFLPIWDTIKTAVFDAWNNYVNNVKANWDIVTTALGNSWTWVKDTLGAGWDWIRDNVFSKFTDTIGSVRDRFSGFVDALGDKWSGLKSLLAKPINFMINTVYNDGILRAWNIIAGILPGLDKGNPLAGIPEHATGGRIVGPGSGTSDDVLMWGSNGEHMLTAREVQDLGGHSAVYAMRNAVDTGKPFTYDGKGGLAILPKTDERAGDLAGAAPGLLIPGFKDGGEIRPMWEIQLENGHRAAKMRNGNPYTWGFEDCSGYMSAIADAIINGGDGKWSWATGSFPGGQPWVPGLGQGFSVGVHDNPGGPGGGHTAGTLTGVGPYSTVNVESGGGHGYVAYGGPAAGADSPQFQGVHPGQFHLAIGADGAFESGGGGGFDPGAMRSWISEKLGGVVDTIMGPIVSLLPEKPPEWQGIPRGVYDSGRDGLVESIADGVAGLADGLATVWNAVRNIPDLVADALNGADDVNDAAGEGYHKGGLAGRGRGLMQKTAIEPEMVLNPAMTQSFLKWMDTSPESARIVARELSAAFEGGDFGSGETASYIGSRNAERLLDEVSWIGATVDEVKAAWTGGDAGYAGLARYLGGNGELARSILDRVESIGTVTEEISAAWAGGDFGYGELASYVGEPVAKASLDVVAAAGDLHRAFGALGSVIMSQFKTPEVMSEVAGVGRGYLESQATSLLDVVGLGGLVPLASDMADKHGPALAQSAQDMFGGISVSGSLGPGGATVIIEAESDEDLVRVGQLKALADHVHGLDVQVNAKKRPPAAAVTRGGVM